MAIIKLLLEDFYKKKLEENRKNYERHRETEKVSYDQFLNQLIDHSNILKGGIDLLGFINWTLSVALMLYPFVVVGSINHYLEWGKDGYYEIADLITFFIFLLVFVGPLVYPAIFFFTSKEEIFKKIESDLKIELDVYYGEIFKINESAYWETQRKHRVFSRVINMTVKILAGLFLAFFAVSLVYLSWSLLA